MGKAYRKRKIVSSDQSSFPLSFIEHPVPPASPPAPFFAPNQPPLPSTSHCYPFSASSHPCNFQCYPPPPSYSYPTIGSDRSRNDLMVSPTPLPPRGNILIGRHAARFDVKTPPSMRGRNRHNLTAIPKTFVNPMVSSRRGCTDVICCFLFIVFVIGWAFVAILGFIWGKPEHLIHPTDSNGRMCGVELQGYYNLRSKPYLFYFDLTKCISYSVVFSGCQTPQICVAKCPLKTFTYLQMQSVPSGAQFQADVQSSIICKANVPMKQIQDFATLRSYVERGECASYTVPSAAVLGRCLPQIILNLGSAAQKAQEANSSLDRIVSALGGGGGLIPTDGQIANTSNIVGTFVDEKSVLEKIAFDISVTWWQILTMFLITALIALLWIIVMRILGRFLIWATILFVVIILGAGAGYCWYRCKMLYDAGAITDYSFQPDISVYFEMPTTWLIIAIVLSVALLVVLIILLFVRTRITLAVALIEESSKAIGCIMSSLLFPIFAFLMHFLAFILWALVTIWLATSGTENCLMPRTPGGTLNDGVPCDCSKLGTGSEPGCQYINMTRDETRVFAMQAFNLFGFFWMSCFVSGLADMTLAGAFASYYWALNKPKDVPSFPIIRSIGRAIRYHLGTIAFASLILATVKFLRAMLNYLDKKLSAAKNAVAKFILM
uniref:Choline transporter-like protein n=1 Tax=Ascaris suum TaxID=6253 RepID=F1KVQ8_ASCSU